MRRLRRHNQSHLRSRLPILLALILFFPWPTKAQLEPGRIQTRTEEFPAESGIKTRVFSLTDGDEHGELLLSHSVNTPTPQILFAVWRGDGPRRLDPDRSIPIERRMQFFRPLFKCLLETEPSSKTYNLGVYGYAELYDRLLDLAARDKAWNRRYGTPYAKSIGYSYIQHLLERGDAFREIVSAMKAFHYDVNIADALEEQLTVQVKTLSPEQKKHISVPVRETDWLPVRIAVTFRLLKEQR